jgi:hypothetical protein
MQMCPEAAKFRIAPLQDEEDLKTIFDKNVVTNVTARVPPSSHDRAAKAAASQNNLVNVEDLDGSGCEGETDTNVTPLRAQGKKNKRPCPYSPSPALTPKAGSGSASRFDRVMELIEKKEEKKEQLRLMEEEKSRNSVTSPEKKEEKKDSVRQEIRRMVAKIVQDGGKPGMLEYFYATQLFILQEYRDVFICLEEDATPAQRLDWLRMTWEQHNKKLA